MYRQKNKECDPSTLDGWQPYLNSAFPLIADETSQNRGEAEKSDTQEGTRPVGPVHPACGSDPVQIILWNFFFPIMQKWFIRPELLLGLCSAPELLSSLYQLPGGCCMTIYPRLAAQSLCLRATITAATSYSNHLNWAEWIRLAQTQERWHKLLRGLVQKGA